MSEQSDDRWMTVGHVPIKVKVDSEGNPHGPVFFLSQHVAEGHLGTGEEFLVSANLAGGDLIVSMVGRPETYVVSTRDLMEVINEMWARKKDSEDEVQAEIEQMSEGKRARIKELYGVNSPEMIASVHNVSIEAVNRLGGEG